MTDIRKRAAEGLQAGDRFVISRSFSKAEIEAFAQLSKDFNPVHYDQSYIALKGFEAPIAHGLLTASLITEIGGQIGWLASGMSFRFRRPVYADELLQCEWLICSIDERGRAQAKAVVKNSQEQTVLEADITGIVPNEAERIRLKALIACPLVND
ncbi:MAG: MaoC family dehydratase [Betaproteobacteria bacterium]|jgi:acyl dehydratase|nr:MaoC family dehydratase [Betaproteobacteria bacterium]